MINRSCIILKLKEPAIRWINKADPDPDFKITLDYANNDSTVYLIQVDDGIDDMAMGWVELNYSMLFESELESWYTEESLWPQDRTLKLFKEWFDVESHSVIEDTVKGKVKDLKW